MADGMDRPPPLSDMFINSIDTLKQREINQKLDFGWNEKPPLFTQFRPKRQRFWQAPVSTEVTEEEDPTLLKGVSSYCFRTLKMLLGSIGKVLSGMSSPLSFPLSLDA